MKKLLYIPVAAVLLVFIVSLFRRHSAEPSVPASTSPVERTGLSPIKPVKHPEKPVSSSTPPVAMELPPGAASPDTKGIRGRAQALLPGLRPLLHDFLVKYPFTGAAEEMAAQKERLKAAIGATQDPAVIAALVLWGGEAGDRMDALAFLRNFVLESLRQQKDTADWIRARDVSHFLAEIEADGDQPLPARLFALDFLTAQLELMDPQKSGKIPLSMYCLDQSDLGLLAGALRQSVRRADAQFYQPLLKVIGAYLAVSSVARASITDLLAPPPTDQGLRLGLFNAIGSSQSRILEDPAAFQLLLSGLKEPNDLRINSAAALAFAHSPTLVSGAAPEGREVLATLCAQFRGIKGDLSDSRTLRGQQQIFLVSIASADIEGAAAVVKDALLDPSVPNAAKLTALKRIQNIASGAIGVDHGYQKTGPALVEAITSVQTQLSTQPLFPDAIKGCLQSLQDVQRR
jgi:hypothetical protein